MNNSKKIKHMALMGVLTAVALTIFVIESAIPPLTAIPGIKLGLANVVTLFALVVLGPRDAFIILVIRVFLGCVFTGQITALAYSMTGGILCLICETLLLKLLPIKNLWAISVVGATVHNAAQITVAVLMTSTVGIFWYLPYLIIAGIITGAFIGAAVQFTIKKCDSIIKKLL